jgi:hypothetical protein
MARNLLIIFALLLAVFAAPPNPKVAAGASMVAALVFEAAALVSGGRLWLGSRLGLGRWLGLGPGMGLGLALVRLCVRHCRHNE